MPRHLSTPIGG